MIEVTCPRIFHPHLNPPQSSPVKGEDVLFCRLRADEFPNSSAYSRGLFSLKLRPKLLAELKPGARIVSHHFDMGDWEPERTVKVGDGTIYLWRVPEKKE